MSIMKLSEGKRFNKLGIKNLDITKWSDEAVCHWVKLEKSENKEIIMIAEVTINLYDEQGNCYAAVVETELEDV